MKLKVKKAKFSHDQDSSKCAEMKSKASTRGRRKVVVDSCQGVLKGFISRSKIQAKANEEMAREIITDQSVPSKSKNSVRKLQVKLTRCNEEDSELYNGANADMDANSEQLNGKVMPTSTTGKRNLVKASKKSKEVNNIPRPIPDVAENVQKLKKNSSGRKKRLNDICDNEQLSDDFSSGTVTRKLQLKVTRCDDLLQESVETPTIKNDSELSTDVAKHIKSVPNKSGSKRKRGGGGDRKEDDAKPAKLAKKDQNSDKPKGSREKIPDVTSIDFSNDSQSPSGNKWNFKISSWNVNGIRAWLEKNGLSYLHHEKPDIMCIQETKCSDDKLPDEVKEIEGYHAYWLSGDKDGYSGVGLLSKQEPIKVEYGIGIAEHDNEGRVITAEYEKFYLVSAYVPNAGRKLVRLDYRMKWDEDFRAYLKSLDAKKPVVLCGDLNVAHEEIDLANPKTNKKNAGFTKEEREGFSVLLSEGFTDSFRHLYPDVTAAYTFWTYMMNARAKNVGWRLDYFVISERFRENLCDSTIRKDVFGSDHCPIALFLSI